MSPRLVLIRSLFAAALLALPFAEGGCGRTACFTWSSQEGSCPAQSEAMAFFSDPKCPGRVTSVDSPPTADLDGTLCCYAVTQVAEANQLDCLGAGGFNSGSSEDAVFAASTGVGGFGGNGGAGGEGGGAPCLRCAEALGNASSFTLCDVSAAVFNAVLDCACKTTCLDDCASTFCSGVQPSGSCNDCLGDFSSLGCGKELNACGNDI